MSSRENPSSVVGVAPDHTRVKGSDGGLAAYMRKMRHPMYKLSCQTGIFGHLQNMSSLAARVDKLEAEVGELRSLVTELKPPSMKRVTTVQNPTRADIGAAAKQALVDIPGREKIEDWGLSAMYQNDDRIGEFTVEANRIYPGRELPKVNLTRFAFVGGPGPILIVDGAQETLAEPAWGVGGIFPYLVKADTPFFNGHIPSNASVAEWFPGIYNAIRFCDGFAIITFYGQPWDSYFEAAVTLYLMAQGAPSLFFLTTDLTVPYEKAAHVQNIPGTPNVGCSTADRQADINNIIRAALRMYDADTKDPTGRVFRTLHHSNHGNGIEASIACATAGVPSITPTLSQRIMAGGMATAPKFTLATRQKWRSTIFRGAKTDSAIYLLWVYELAFLTSAALENSSTYAVELAHVQGTVAGLVCNFKYSQSPEKQWMAPVVMLLNAMLPEKVDM